MTQPALPHWAYPNRDEHGAPIVKPAAGLPPRHHERVARDARLAEGLRAREPKETAPLQPPAEVPPAPAQAPPGK